MSSNALAIYLEEVQRVSEKESPVRKRRLAEWHKALDRLYRTLARLMNGYVKTTTCSVDLYEKGLGAYSAKALTLEVGAVRLGVVPKGLRVIGAQGRVDITGPSGIVRIIRLADQENDEWLLALYTDRPRELAPLDADSLAAAFRYVIDGPNTATAASPARACARPRRR